MDDKKINNHANNMQPMVKKHKDTVSSTLMLSPKMQMKHSGIKNEMKSEDVMLDEKIETVSMVPSNETKQEVSKDMPMMGQKHSMMVDKKELLPNTGEESTTPLTLVGTMLLSILGFLGFKTKKED